MVFGSTSLFGAPQNQGQTFQFRPVQIDTSLIGLQLQANLLKASAPYFSSTVPNKLPSARDEAVIAPWEINPEQGSLASRINEVRALGKFIDDDPRSDHVKLALSDKTSKSLFVLYKALDALRTIAQYAAEKNTLESALPRLDTQFQQGLSEIQEYLPTATLDKLTLFFGDKQSYIKSPAGQGSNLASYEGQIIQTGGLDDAIAGIAGTESFTIRLTKSGTTKDFTINLADIGGTVSINSLVAHVNGVLEADGTFQSRLESTKDDNYDYGIGISGSSLEELQFIAVAPEPALYVTSDFTGFSSSTETGTLTKILDAEGVSPTRELSSTVAGEDLYATEIAEQAALQAAAESGDSDATPDAVDPVNATTTTSGIATDSEGFVYVLGQTKGSFDSQINSATGEDVFLNKYDSLGNLVYSRLVGSGGDADAYSIIVDSSDNVIIAGQTDTSLATDDYVSGLDSFVAKYDKAGTEIFTYQLDTVSTDKAVSLAVDSNGDIIVGGDTSGAISSTSGFGGVRDGVLLKLDGTDGTLLSSALLGGAGTERIKAVDIASDGDLLVTTVEDGTAYLRKISSTDLSTEVYNIDLGSIDGDITDIQTDGSGNVYIAGYTTNTNLTGGAATIVNTHGGGTDGFILKVTDAGGSGTADTLTYVGGSGTDMIKDLTLANGNVYVAGSSTGSVNGETTAGIVDSFAASLDGSTLAVNYVEQFGQSLGTSAGTGVAFVASGTSVLETLGLPTGTVSRQQTRDLLTQTSLREGDYFYISVNGAPKRKISISAGETVESLATKIKTTSFTRIDAEAVSGDGGPFLKITALRDAELEFLAGSDGEDALAKLGIAPGKLLASEKLFLTDPDKNVIDDNDLGGVFGLDLSPGLHVLDKTTAKFALNKLEAAVGTIQRAYRSLSIDPVKYQLLQEARFNANQGTAPAHITAKIANFQDALTRLQASSQSSSSGFLL